MNHTALLLFLVGCTSGPDREPWVPPAWDPAPADLDCANTAEAPLLEDALEDAAIRLDEVGYSDAEYRKASYASVLDDAFRLPWFRDLQANATAIPCFSAEKVDALEHYAALDHPLTGGLWTAMEILAEPHPQAPLDPMHSWPLAPGLARLMVATGRDDDWDASHIPEELGAALGPIFGAMAEVIEAWEILAASAPDDLELLHCCGHGGILPDFDSGPDVADEAVQDWVIGPQGPRVLYGPTLQLAFAIEHAHLEDFAGRYGPSEMFSLWTPMGRILIAGSGPDEPGELEEVLFYLDLGGDDVYEHEAGGNAEGMPLSLMIDLDGDDWYGYHEKPDPFRDGDRLPSDRDGRYAGDGTYGNFSLSRYGRQGAGRLGVGLLLDLGEGNDVYRSHRMSQGWGHLGVGVLLDDGGDDVYAGEAGVQGGASMGIGLLLDGGGNDTYRTYTVSQGFAWGQAVGILADRGDGGDEYWSDPGKLEDGGDLIYPSAQLAGIANSSFTQGAAWGRRGDADGGYLSGGFALLSDGGGDDVYSAAVFAQGTGYWQGMGVLADAGGDDLYDAYWYVQGGAAHYAIGALLDGGGNDGLLQRFSTPHNMHMGAGHDFSIGVYIDERGDDTYRYTSLAAGASNCQGIGIFVDNDGEDVYEALSTRSTGLGNHSTECGDPPRTDVESIGLFLDSGGDTDTYIWPGGNDHPEPADDSTFGFAQSGDINERGGGVDGDGETGHHATGHIP